MIPKTIWQTNKKPRDSYQPDQLILSDTWKNLDGFTYEYIDDNQMEQYVKTRCGFKWYDIFMRCPFGVMKADIWRYLIINGEGGIYADFDTECKIHPNNWLKDYDFVVSEECYGSHYLCQWMFASTPKHKILVDMLDYLKTELEGFDYSKMFNIIQTTGPTAWTKSIKKTLGFNNFKEINDLETSKIFNVHWYDEWFNFSHIEHHFWGTNGWKKDFFNILNKQK